MRRESSVFFLPHAVSEESMKRWHILTAIALAGLMLSWPARAEQSAPFDDAFVEARSALVRTIGQASELVIVGTVVTVGPPPPAWSGRLRARQAVALKVERVLKGFAPEPTVTVYEPVVSNSRLAATTPAPGLSSKIFRPGNLLIIFARKGEPPETFDGVDENVGAFPSSPRNDIATQFALGLR